MQMPNDLAGWLTVIGSLSGAMWFVIQNTFVKSMNDLNKAIAGLQETLKIMIIGLMTMRHEFSC